MGHQRGGKSGEANIRYRWCNNVLSIIRDTGQPSCVFVQVPLESASAKRGTTENGIHTAEFGGQSYSCVGGVGRRRRDVFSDAFPQARNAWLVFFTTFSVFPGVALRWTSANGMPDSRFRPIVAGVFQVGDIIGRYTPSATWAQVRPDFVKFFAFARIVFVPLFIYLAQHETSDILTISVMLIFSVSNGYCATLSMMYGPGQVSRKNEKEMVGYLMVTFLVGGILSGSLAAFPVANQFFPPNY